MAEVDSRTAPKKKHGAQFCPNVSKIESHRREGEKRTQFKLSSINKTLKQSVVLLKVFDYTVIKCAPV